MEWAANHFGLAWVALCVCLAIHVADEALTDFLSVYNPNVLAIRKRVPFLPIPTFTLKSFLGLLISAVVVLLALSPFAFRGDRWMVPLSYVFGVVMFMNGLWHIISSIYMRRWMPGVYSSPLLLAVSAWLLAAARTH
ncbi:MAG: HXXEE domain-containing protein [Terriglobia bacterium]|jgi:hypothetical protein